MVLSHCFTTKYNTSLPIPALILFSVCPVKLDPLFVSWIRLFMWTLHLISLQLISSLIPSFIYKFCSQLDPSSKFVNVLQNYLPLKKIVFPSFDLTSPGSYVLSIVFPFAKPNSPNKCPSPLS